MTRFSAGSVLSVMRAAWGIVPGARLTSAFFSIHSAQCFASHRVWRRFRKGRSDSVPSKASPPAFVSGNTIRHLARFFRSSRTSPKAKSEKAGDAMSRADCAARHFRNSSITRSLPPFLMSFNQHSPTLNCLRPMPLKARRYRT